MYSATYVKCHEFRRFLVEYVFLFVSIRKDTSIFDAIINANAIICVYFFFITFYCIFCAFKKRTTSVYLNLEREERRNYGTNPFVLKL